MWVPFMAESFRRHAARANQKKDKRRKHHIRVFMIKPNSETVKSYEIYTKMIKTPGLEGAIRILRSLRANSQCQQYIAFCKHNQ